jgi:hypothetical protein
MKVELVKKESGREVLKLTARNIFGRNAHDKLVSMVNYVGKKVLNGIHVRVLYQSHEIKVTVQSVRMVNGGVEVIGLN